MRVFITGATGFVGSAVVKELIDGGHQVLGLARSDASAKALEAVGAGVHRGDLENLDSLKAGALAADAVIHTGFIHDFTRFKEVCEVDRVAIEAIGDALAGSNKPFIVTSGTAIINPGNLATEDMPAPTGSAVPRVSEAAAEKVTAMGVHTCVVRLSPSVHGEGDHHGFVPILVKTAREKGYVGYIDEGKNRWNAVHRLDAAKVYTLALENAVAGARLHAVAEEAISFKAIAEAIGQQLNIPVKSIPKENAADYYGWFLHFAGIDVPASSKKTRALLKWTPTHSTLLEDLGKGIYTK